MKDWQKVPLGDIITYRKEFIEIDELQEYKRCRVQLHAKGVVLRDIITGALLKTKKQQVCRAGEFLVAEIDAKVGGYGIVPEELEGAIVSSHYFLFSIDEIQLDRRFLDYFIRTPEFRDQVTARGSTNYAAIRPKHVLNYVIPLPPLSEQQRIVAKIEQLAAKVEEAKNLNESALKQTESILWTAKNKVFNRDSSSEWSMMRLEEVAPVNMGQSPPGHSYNSEEEGIPLLNGPTEFGKEHPKEVQWATEPTKLCKEGDLLICVRGATTGRTNWADKKYCIGRGLAALTVNQNICLPKYVYHFMTFSTQKLLALSAGSTFPNLPGARLKALKIPCPSLEEQCCIVAYLDNLQAKIDSLKHFQAQTQTELDALLPSILDKAFKGEL